MSFGGLYISVSGIYANKKSLDTVSHNIANANNKDYVRQNAIHAESRYSRISTASLRKGTGVDVQTIRQIRDEFLDIRLRSEKSLYGYYSTKSDMLEEIEAIFNELTSSSLQNAIDDFWNAWNELYKEPDSLTIRGLLHESAVAFTTTVNHISSQLNNLQYDLNKEMIARAEEVNSILEDIVKLNKQIWRTSGSGEKVSANDLKDTLNAKIDRLSELIPIKYYEDNLDGAVITLNGKSLVDGDYFNPLKIEMDEKNFGQVYWAGTGERVDLSGKGELGGYIDARDKVVTEYRDRLNILVATLAEVINAIHRKGYTLEEPPTSGIDFFQLDLKDPSATIKLNPELADFTRIAVSLTGAEGDGEIARAILNLRNIDLYGKFDEYNKGINGIKYIHDSIANWIANLSSVDDIDLDIINSLEGLGLSMNSDEFYKDLILDLSLDRQEAQHITESQNVLISQLEERKQEISGVSLDEEMANMIKYQYSYVANSRVINAIDEMLNQIINGIGVTR